MRTIIAGGRDYQFTQEDIAVLNALRSRITEVVCGGASGADECGRQWAIANNIPVKMFPADWTKYGKSAGPRRNRQMAEYGEWLILFWDGVSAGSKNMRDVAQELGLAVTVYLKK